MQEVRDKVQSDIDGFKKVVAETEESLTLDDAQRKSRQFAKDAIPILQDVLAKVDVDLALLPRFMNTSGGGEDFNASVARLPTSNEG